MAILDYDTFDLVERQLVARSVVQLRSAWRLVRGNLLGLLNRPAVLKVRRDGRSLGTGGGNVYVEARR